MKIHYKNNHIILPVQTEFGIKNILLDTGNPFTTVLNDDKIKEIEIDDVNFKLAFDNMTMGFKRMIIWKDISNFIGTSIDGFLGYDFLIKNDIIIDLIDYKLILNQYFEDFEFIDISLFRNVPILNLEIQGKRVKSVFDTGAMYSIIKSNLSNILVNKNESIEDHNPMLGYFRADLYLGDISLCRTLIKNCTIACSQKYDIAISTLKGEGVEGFLGIESLKGKKIFLSYRDKKFGIR